MLEAIWQYIKEIFPLLMLIGFFAFVALTARLAGYKWSSKYEFYEWLGKKRERWENRNKEGRCGSCNSEFIESNPDAGGGQCLNCWASWG